MILARVITLLLLSQISNEYVAGLHYSIKDGIIVAKNDDGTPSQRYGIGISANHEPVARLDCCYQCGNNYSMYEGRCYDHPMFKENFLLKVQRHIQVNSNTCCSLCGLPTESERWHTKQHHNTVSCIHNQTTESSYLPNGTVQSFFNDIYKDMRCTACTGLVAVIREAKNVALDRVIDTIKLRAMSYCNVLILFSGACQHYINDQMNSILSHIDRGLNNEAICRNFLHMCNANETLLQAKKSRKYIIPEDEVYTVDDIIQHQPWNSDRLSHEFQIGNSREAADHNMKFVARMGLIANSRPCPNDVDDDDLSLMSLNYAAPTKVKDQFEWRCPRCRSKTLEECEKDFSFRASIRDYSFFYKSNLEFKQLFQLMYYWSKHHKSNQQQIMDEVGVSKHTVVDWYNFFRDVCQETIYRRQTTRRLRGVIEIDESKFFKAKYNRGRMLNRRSGWVFGMIERGSNDVRLFPVERRDAATLLPIIAANVEAGSTVYSDGWAAYGGIVNLQMNYNRGWVNHRINFVNPDDPMIHTQSIEATWGGVKRDMKHLYGTTPELFPTYLFQYMFRRMYNRERLFEQLIINIRDQYPLTDPLIPPDNVDEDSDED